MNKNTKGCLWIALPMAVFPLILGVWAVLSFLFASFATAETLTRNGELFARIVNMVLGFCGILSLLMIPVGLVVGVVILMTKDESPTVPPSVPPTPPSSTPNLM